MTIKKIRSLTELSLSLSFLDDSDKMNDRQFDNIIRYVKKEYSSILTVFEELF